MSDKYADSGPTLLTLSDMDISGTLFRCHNSVIVSPPLVYAASGTTELKCFHGRVLKNTNSTITCDTQNRCWLAGYGISNFVNSLPPMVDFCKLAYAPLMFCDKCSNMKGKLAVSKGKCVIGCRKEYMDPVFDVLSILGFQKSLEPATPSLVELLSSIDNSIQCPKDRRINAYKKIIAECRKMTPEVFRTHVWGVIGDYLPQEFCGLAISPAVQSILSKFRKKGSELTLDTDLEMDNTIVPSTPASIVSTKKKIAPISMPVAVKKPSTKSKKSSKSAAPPAVTVVSDTESVKAGRVSKNTVKKVKKVVPIVTHPESDSDVVSDNEEYDDEMVPLESVNDTLIEDRNLFN